MINNLDAEIYEFKKIHGHILVEKEFHSIFPLFPILYHSKWRQDLKVALIF